MTRKIDDFFHFGFSNSFIVYHVLLYMYSRRSAIAFFGLIQKKRKEIDEYSEDDIKVDVDIDSPPSLVDSNESYMNIKDVAKMLLLEW